MKCSVVLCTHNPRPDYLVRVLESLSGQSLSKDHWEFLFVDNASSQHLSNEWDISWHLNGHHIREDELGLTPARLRGIREAKADLLVFVDDDNVLAPDYLEQTLAYANERPNIGAFSGKSLPEFDRVPPIWLKNFYPYLALRDFAEDIVTEKYFDWSAMPIGAGLCVRQRIAREYLDFCILSPVRKNLDRKGQVLVSGGDSDLVMVALDLKFQIGLTTRLSLINLIPKERCSEQYILRLMEGHAFSNELLSYLRGVSTVDARSLLRKAASLLKLLLMKRGFERKIALAQHRGRNAFIKWRHNHFLG